MNHRLPLVALAAALVGLASVPSATADLTAPVLGDVPVDVPMESQTSAAAAELALLACRSTGGDWDRDGEIESWNVCSTPTCGCACPVVGAGVVVEAADQERGAWVATSGCQTGYGTMTDEGDGEAGVTPFVWTWGVPEILVLN